MEPLEPVLLRPQYLAVFNSPVGIVLNNTGTIAYVTNGGNTSATVSICPINSDGTFGTCKESAAVFNLPRLLALNSAGTHLYVPNLGNSTVSFCPINSDGSIGTCTAVTGFIGPTGIALNDTETLAYVANFNSTIVSVCPINSDGSLGTCSNSGDTFYMPAGIALF